MKAKKRASELDYLRYFYDAVQPALGPADDDIISMIRDDFEQETGQRPPIDYDEEDDNA